jgi:hypothetical protein
MVTRNSGRVCAVGCQTASATVSAAAFWGWAECYIAAVTFSIEIEGEDDVPLPCLGRERWNLAVPWIDHHPRLRAVLDWLPRVSQEAQCHLTERHLWC